MALWLLIAQTPSIAAPKSPFTLAGRVEDPELGEISGIATSHRQAGVYWVHNDSFNPERIFAVDADGKVLARVTVKGAVNLDWEDIASFEQDGKPYLAIGDIGNNAGLDSDLHIYLVPEPALQDHEVSVLRDLRFRFADGPRDAESLTVDLAQQRYLIADKGRQPAGLYALPMDGREHVATRIAEVPHLSLRRATPVRPLSEANGNALTAMDLSADGRRLLLLTYRDVLLFERRPDEDWNDALARAPRGARLPARRGFEAACWTADGRQILIADEGLPALIYRWQVE